jgi:hypothetical protein
MRWSCVGEASLTAADSSLAEFAGYVVVVGVAEAGSDVVADVNLVRAVAAVDRAGFPECGFGGGSAGPGAQLGVGVVLPGGERGEQVDCGVPGTSVREVVASGSAA